jgi:hypothetical protein
VADANTAVTGMDDIHNNLMVHDEEFSAIIKSEELSVINEHETSMKTVADDVIREEIDMDMLIAVDRIENNGSVIMENYYDLRGILYDDMAVLYKPTITMKDSMSFTAWVNIHEKNGKFLPQIVSQQMVGYNMLKLKFESSVESILSMNDTLYNIDSYLDIVDIDEDTATVLCGSLLSHLTGWSISEKVNLFKVIDDNYVSVDILNGKVIRYRFDYEQYDNSGFNFEECKWYGVVINISKAKSYFGAYQWSLKNNEKYSTALNLDKKSEVSINGTSFSGQPMLYSSNSSMGCIRYWKKAIPESDQQYVMSTKFVKDTSLVNILDNCERVLNIGVIGRGNTYTTERQNSLNK